MVVFFFNGINSQSMKACKRRKESYGLSLVEQQYSQDIQGVVQFVFRGSKTCRWGTACLSGSIT